MVEEAKITISPEKKELLIKEIIDYFATEKDIEMGLIGAEEIFDFFVKALGREVYNQAIEDSQKVIREGSENIIVNVGTLTKL